MIAHFESHAGLYEGDHLGDVTRGFALYGNYMGLSVQEVRGIPGATHVRPPVIG